VVKRGEDLRVLDGETGEDLTKRILVQIILESETALDFFPLEFLRQLIQLRSGPLGHWMSQYLAAGAQWMSRQVSSSGPAMRNVQDSLQGLFAWMRGPDGSTYTPPKPDVPYPTPHKAAAKPQPEAESERKLAEEIGSLQQRLADLAKRVSRR